jgi:hypothetical protein
MNKITPGLLALIFALSAANMALAQEKAQKEETAVAAPKGTPAEALKSKETREQAKAEPKKAVSVKPQIQRMGGEVTAVDLKTGTLSFHQETVHHDRVMRMKVDEKIESELKNLHPGDLVNVWIKDGKVSELQKAS